jgi:hypothetical protein
MNKVTPIDVPLASALSRELHNAHFHDCYSTAIDTDQRSAFELYLSVASHMPAWVNFLMDVRNKIVPLVGLRDAGRLDAIDPNKPASSYRIGDRVGVFSLIAQSRDEVILGIVDTHLNVKVSVCKMHISGQLSVAVSTVVHVHNALGRLYMFVVAPVHKVIALAVLSRAVF